MAAETVLIPARPRRLLEATPAADRGAGMTGIITLVLLALLCAFVLRWLARRLRVRMPTYFAVFVVFALVVLALWGQSQK